MIKIILILLLIHYIGLYLFKPKHDILYCGLFGWAGKDVKKFNKDKFDKLGILNVERGKSSCGISYDGDIQIGIDSQKYYYDFIIEREIKPKRFPVLIGHTRQSSVGLVNVFNAHPFGFGDNNGDYIFIGAHNGTLKNHKELAKKYEIEESVESYHYDKNNKEINVKRNKIDSEILLEIIYKSKNFKVLSEYVGGAALVFTDTTNPNILYLFKGKSKDYQYSNFETNERPLFVYIENKNSMYFSSLEDSLKTIGGKNDNIVDIDSNTIYKITDGDFNNAEKIIISRANATQNPIFNNRNYGHNYGAFEEDWHFDVQNDAFRTKKEKEEEKSTSIITLPAAKTVIEKEIKKDINIYEEIPLRSFNDYKGVPYFNKLRWWRNGKLITGIYIWINNYGYFPVGDTLKTATESFWFYADKVFNGKSFCIDKTISGIIPIDSSKIIEPNFFYFIEGVQVKTFLDYAHFYKKYESISRNNFLDYIQLSQIATHPVINLNFKFREKEDQNILRNGIIVNDLTITLLGADKTYTIKKGNLVKTEQSYYYLNFKEDYCESKIKEIENFPNTLKLSKEFETTILPIVTEQDEILEQNDDEMLENMVAKEEEENQIIRDLCEEDFTEPIKDFQQIRTKLFNNFSDNSLAVKVINFVDNAMKDMTQFINQ